MQGAFAEHETALRKLGAETFLVRNKQDWAQEKDGLVIPGGESTAMTRIMRDEELWNPIRDEILGGLPVFGTCAGLIMLDKEHLSTMNITALRNAYGRQLGSFITDAPLKGFGEYPMVFIRAPYIEKCTPDVDILATVDDKIVAVQYKNQIGLAFHPEMSDNTVIHEHFINMCK